MALLIVKVVNPPLRETVWMSGSGSFWHIKHSPVSMSDVQLVILLPYEKPRLHEVTVMSAGRYTVISGTEIRCCFPPNSRIICTTKSGRITLKRDVVQSFTSQLVCGNTNMDEQYFDLLKITKSGIKSKNQAATLRLALHFLTEPQRPIKMTL